MQLTDEQKILIIEYKNTNHSVTEIIKKTGIKRRTIYDVLKNYEKRGTVERKKGSGRPKIFDQTGVRRLVNTVKQDNRLTLSQIATMMPEGASIDTIRRVLHKEGIFNKLVKENTT